MKKILTIILDGFGMREDSYGNAIKNAGMSNFINAWNNYPHCLLKTSDKALGITKEATIDSTFGHKIIGAGRPIKHKLSQINEQLSNNQLKENANFIKMVNSLKEHGGNLHILFLLSDGGVSSHINYLSKILTILKEQNFLNKIYLDLISDGIDSDKNSLNSYLQNIEPLLDNKICISSLCGRYYALDETKDYKRTKMFYNLLLFGDGIEVNNLEQMINLCYQKKLNDTYIPPLKTSNYQRISDGDVVLFLNFSKFNQEPLLEALTKDDFIEFPIRKVSIEIYSLFEIDKKYNKNYFFEEEKITNPISEYMQELGVSEAKIVESVKRPSLTYYFNGSKKTSYANSDVYIVDSPMVERFDLKPEMNALTVAKTAIKCMEKDYDIIFVNFANADSVGHTGNYQATINSLQAVDVCLGKLLEVAEENFYKVIILGSHGKADTIIDRKNNIITKNTDNPVPFIILDKKVKLKNGNLTNVAPTILKYMDISLPKEMKDTENLFIEE